jgi:peptidyl-tRNA hydrolase, PTH1 family
MSIEIETNNLLNNNPDSPFMIVGLGNPGREYRTNRHNVGFMVMDRLANRLGVKFTRVEFKALLTKGDYKGRKVILAKPQTFMNLSGQSVGALVQFYKIPFGNLLVVYDDVDLPFNLLRLRPEGGSAGHKGMLSIIEKLDTQEIPRLRLGIGRPPGQIDAAGYVLQNFTGEDAEFVPGFLDRAVDAVLIFMNEGLVTAMNKFNNL